MSKRIVDQLSFIQQPCDTSCVSACIAMALNLPVAKVVDEFHGPYREREIGIADYLDEHEVPYRCFWSKDNHSIREDGVYLVTVPSLNIQASNHQILCVFENELFWVIDPNHGKAGKLCYMHGGDTGENEVKLQAFIIDFFIPASYYSDGGRLAVIDLEEAVA